jgi:DNA-binding IscR family transcriptional regulator
MKLTTKSEYLLLALIYIARHDKDSFIKIEDICSAYDIPKKYLEQLFFRSEAKQIPANEARRERRLQVGKAR